MFDDFKALADKKKEIYDADLIALIEKHIQDVPAHWTLVSLHTTAGTSVTADGHRLHPPPRRPARAGRRDRRRPGRRDLQGGRARHGRSRPTCASSPSAGVTAGKDAQGEVSLELEVESDDRSFRGRAASTDIIEASAQAYLNAVNAIATRRDRGQPREVIGRPGAGA